MKVTVKDESIVSLRIRDVKIGAAFVFEELLGSRKIEPGLVYMKTTSATYYNFVECTNFTIADAYQRVTLVDAELIVNGRVK